MKLSKWVLATAIFAASWVASDARAEGEASELWAKECAKCHGADGTGQTKMGRIQKVKDLTDATVRAGFDRDRMIASVKNGILKEDGKTPWMKGFADKLTDEQIAALVDYVINEIGAAK